MKLFRTIGIPVCSFIFVLSSLFFLHQGSSHAEMKPLQPSSQRQFQINEPISVPNVGLYPDLKVSLNIVKNSGGLIILNGTITNIGNKDYNIPSEAQYFMNLRYPPKTYAQIGVSDQLFTKAFSQVKKGASFPVNCTYKVPNFDGWVEGIMTPTAKRLFTLRVVKKDMSSFKPGEDGNQSNNSMGVEVGNDEKQH